MDVFWHKLSKYEDDRLFYSFKNLSLFVLNVISFPHSNAECERIFSAVNLTKTKTRNKLVTLTVNGVLLANQRINKDCVSFEPSFHEYSRMTKTLLYSGKKFNNNESTINCMTESEDRYCHTK